MAKYYVHLNFLYTVISVWEAFF